MNKSWQDSLVRQIVRLIPLTNDGKEWLLDSTKETTYVEDIETTAENKSVIDSTKETTHAEDRETTAENKLVIGTESNDSPTSENTKQPAFVHMIVVPNTMKPPPDRVPESHPSAAAAAAPPPTATPPPPTAATPAEANSLNSKNITIENKKR